MTKPRGELEERLISIVQHLQEDRSRASAELRALRQEALASGEDRLATACLRPLAITLDPLTWLEECAPALLTEDPRGRSFWSVGMTQARVGRTEQATKNFKLAVELESREGGDPEILEHAREALAALEASEVFSDSDPNDS